MGYSNFCDILDIFIIKNLLEKEFTTTYEIAREFRWSDKPPEHEKRIKKQFFDAKTNVIHSRIKNLSKIGIINILRDGKNKNIYMLLPEKIEFCRKKFNDGIYFCCKLKGSNDFICIK